MTPPPTVGALFAGTGGLDLAVEAVLGAQLAWVSEVGKAPSKILATRYPDVPNHGDITKVKWSPDCPTCGHLTSLYHVGPDAHRAYWCREHGEFPLSLREDETARTGIAIAEPVDIITGGSPCQDLSHAGKRAGMKAGTRSGLWASMCDAIDIIRPGLVVWENVRGALSAAASSDSDLVAGPGPMGDRSSGHLRALGRVLGDLAELGYDAAWCGLRAADVGAPHGRYRVFVIAWPAGSPPVLDDLTSAPGLLVPQDEEPALLPTPVVNDMGRAYNPQTWDEWTARLKSQHGNGNGHGPSLSIEATRMASSEPGHELYVGALERWERVFGAAAPPAVAAEEDGGEVRLSPRFVEWMMGLPPGWVTDAGITRAEQLKALGNGVVPQQAAAAIRRLVSVSNGPMRAAAA